MMATAMPWATSRWLPPGPRKVRATAHPIPGPATHNFLTIIFGPQNGAFKGANLRRSSLRCGPPRTFTIVFLEACAATSFNRRSSFDLQSKSLFRFCGPRRRPMGPSGQSPPRLWWVARRHPFKSSLHLYDGAVRFARRPNEGATAANNGPQPSGFRFTRPPRSRFRPMCSSAPRSSSTAKGNVGGQSPPPSRHVWSVKWHGMGAKPARPPFLPPWNKRRPRLRSSAGHVAQDGNKLRRSSSTNNKTHAAPFPVAGKMEAIGFSAASR